jgi:hypothetical protein
MGKNLFKSVIKNIGQYVTIFSTFLHSEMICTMDVSTDKKKSHTFFLNCCGLVAGLYWEKP